MTVTVDGLQITRVVCAPVSFGNDVVDFVRNAQPVANPASLALAEVIVPAQNGEAKLLPVDAITALVAITA